MNRYALRIMRQSLSDWLPAIGVIACVCMLIGICVDSFVYTLGLRRAAQLSGDVSEMHAGVMTYYVFIALLTFYALSVIGAAVVNRMRFTFSLWRLVGASPSQVRHAAMVMVVVVALMGAVPGSLLSIPASRLLWPTLGVLGMRVAPTIRPGSMVGMFIVSTLIGVGTCFLGMASTAGKASRVPPIEVFRSRDIQHAAKPVLRLLGWVLFAMSVLMVAIAATFSDTGIWGDQLQSRLADLSTSVGAYMTLSLYAGLLMVAAVYFLSPQITRLLLWLFNALCSVFGATMWVYALRSARAHISANTTFVSALSSGIGCAGVLLIGTRTGETVMRRSGATAAFDYSSTYLIAGLTMLMLLLTALATLMLSGADERHEQALLRVAGMSPSQVTRFRARQSVLMVLASLLVAGIPMAATMLAWAAGAHAVLGEAVYTIPWVELLVTLVAGSLLVFIIQLARLRAALRVDVADGLRQM